MKPMVLCAAPTGNRWTKADNPYLPVTMDEIIADGLAAMDAGAAMVHMHARGEDGGLTTDPKFFAPQLEAFKSRNPEVVLQVSTGFTAPDVTHLLEPLLRLRPDMASFNLKGTEEEIAYMFEVFDRYAVKPAFEAFTVEMVERIKEYIGRGYIKGTPCIELVFDLDGQNPLRQDEQMLEDCLAALPENAFWSLTRGGVNNRTLFEKSLRRGGHFRTGLEDMKQDWDGEFARSSAELIRAAARQSAGEGRTVATAAEARSILGL